MREGEVLGFNVPSTIYGHLGGGGVWGGGGACLLHKQEGARELYKTREGSRERDRERQTDRQTENKFLLTMVMEYSTGIHERDRGVCVVVVGGGYIFTEQ